MLISHHHRFIFFHVPKTGGKSVTRAILPYVHLGVRFGNPLSQWLLRRAVEAHRGVLADAVAGGDLAGESLDAVSKAISRAAWLENRLSLRKLASRYYAFGLKYLLREAPAAFLASYDLTPDYPSERPLSLVHDHASVAFYRRYLPPEMFDGYFKFAFVREPFEWLRSWFSFLTKIWASGVTDARMRRSEPIAFALSRWRGASLGEFVDAVCTQPTLLATLNGGSETPLLGPLCDADGNLLVDYVGKQERLAQDFTTVCDRIGIDAELPTLNVSLRENDEPVLQELRCRVKQTFAEVYSALGYD